MIGRSGFRPVVLNASVAADGGKFSTIFAGNVSREHVALTFRASRWLLWQGWQCNSAQRVPEPREYAWLSGRADSIPLQGAILSDWEG